MNRLTVNLTAGTPRPKLGTWLTVALLVTVPIATVLEPALGYLAILAIASWLALWLTVRGESSPRYRRR